MHAHSHQPTSSPLSAGLPPPPPPPPRGQFKSKLGGKGTTVVQHGALKQMPNTPTAAGGKTMSAEKGLAAYTRMYNVLRKEQMG